MACHIWCLISRTESYKYFRDLLWEHIFTQLDILFVKGMVELVPASDTLRKIQVEYGVTGSFKDKPLAEWLRKYNPSEEEYEKVISIFFILKNFVKIYYENCYCFSQDLLWC